MSRAPIDTSTGLKAGSPVHGTVLVLRGYLVTHSDGTEARLPADKTRADHYAATHAGRTVEPMYVIRPAT
jgi:hypothetical protein